MIERAARKLVLVAVAASFVIAAIAVLLGFGRPQHDGIDAYTLDAILWTVTAVACGIVGAFIVSKQPQNRVGWMFCGISVAAALSEFSFNYAARALVWKPQSLPAGEFMSWVSTWIWVPAVMWLPLLLLVFPTGAPPSPRWRWLVRFFCAAGTVLVALGLALWPYRGGGLLKAAEDLPDWADPVLAIIFPPVMIGIVLSLGAPIVRFRRGTAEERQQLKWVMFAGAVAIGGLVVGEVVLPAFGAADSTLDDIVRAISSPVVIPIAAGIAVLRYRLYDIDVVINKTLVFGGLAAFITVVYVAIVVGIGNLIGQGEEPNLGLSIAATAVVAVAFQPVRERVQRFANRLVYGKRATPYEVLSEFSDRVAETYATEDVLPRMARTVAEGTGAAHAEVWLRSGAELRRAAAWPQDESVGGSLSMSNGSVPDVPGVDRVMEVRHQGEVLGALTVTKPAGEPLTPAEDKLLSDLAGQAGLVLRNVGLTSELLARLEELKASRQRLVAAQDEERRRLERNLHDGAQQHLVALKMKLSLAARLAKDEDEKLRNAIVQLSRDADEALETLRDLARGIYPPLLADQGLKAALESQARKASVPVAVEADGLARYPQEVEAAVYFCVLEALQNVAKYANAGQTWVTVSERDGELVFEVRDDGAGFDPATTPKGAGTTNMSDRLESLGGSLELGSRPGEGTTVSGRLPARVLEHVR